MSKDFYCYKGLAIAAGNGGSALPCWSALTAW